MEWPEILALGTHALNLAIEQLEGRRWQQIYESPDGRNWAYLHQDGHLGRRHAQPYQHTDAWNACMPLLWRYEIGLYPPEPGMPQWLLLGLADRKLYAATEAEAREAICRLALDAAAQTKECSRE